MESEKVDYAVSVYSRVRQPRSGRSEHHFDMQMRKCAHLMMAMSEEEKTEYKRRTFELDKQHQGDEKW